MTQNILIIGETSDPGPQNILIIGETSDTRNILIIGNSDPGTFLL